jgi:hypothetical protein
METIIGNSIHPDHILCGLQQISATYINIAGMISALSISYSKRISALRAGEKLININKLNATIYFALNVLLGVCGKQ